MSFRNGAAVSRHESLIPASVTGVNKNHAASKATINGTKIIVSYILVTGAQPVMVTRK